MPRYPVVPGHGYFVANPPESIELTPDQLASLELRAPFFVDSGMWLGPDRRVVPFVWDDDVGGQPRFSEAEGLTDYDAGSFGLAAVCGATPTDQAKVYAALARGILAVHRANPALLGDWLTAQGDLSASLFRRFDRERPPAEEKLLSPEGAIDRDLWTERMAELDDCLARDAFHKHHFRWIEFLAHSVNVPRLMTFIGAPDAR